LKLLARAPPADIRAHRLEGGRKLSSDREAESWEIKDQNSEGAQTLRNDQIGTRTGGKAQYPTRRFIPLPGRRVRGSGCPRLRRSGHTPRGFAVGASVCVGGGRWMRTVVREPPQGGIPVSDSEIIDQIIHMLCRRRCICDYLLSKPPSPPIRLN